MYNLGALSFSALWGHLVPTWADPRETRPRAAAAPAPLTLRPSPAPGRCSPAPCLWICLCRRLPCTESWCIALGIWLPSPSTTFSRFIHGTCLNNACLNNVACVDGHVGLACTHPPVLVCVFSPGQHKEHCLNAVSTSLSLATSGPWAPASCSLCTLRAPWPAIPSPPPDLASRFSLPCRLREGKWGRSHRAALVDASLGCVFPANSEFSHWNRWGICRVSPVWTWLDAVPVVWVTGLPSAGQEPGPTRGP